MKRFTSAIRGALKSENWYAALYLSLVMPDICGKLAYPNVKHSGQRYKKWFEAYLADINKCIIGEKEVVFLTANDCWALRCSIIHEGVDEITEEKAQKFLNKFYFTTIRVHRILTNNNVLTLNINFFCEEICEAVERWVEEVKGNIDIENRMRKILRIHEEGFSPIRGVLIN